MDDINKWAKENGVKRCPSCGTYEFDITSTSYKCGARHGFECDDSFFDESVSGCDVKGSSIAELKRDIERGYVCEDVKVEELTDVVADIACMVKNEDKQVINKLITDIVDVLFKYRRNNRKAKE